MRRKLPFALLLSLVTLTLAGCYVVPALPPNARGVPPPPPPALATRPGCPWTYGQGWYGWGWYATGC